MGLQQSSVIGDKMYHVEVGRRARCQRLLALANYGKFVVSTSGIQVVAKFHDAYSKETLILDNVWECECVFFEKYSRKILYSVELVVVAADFCFDFLFARPRCCKKPLPCISSFASVANVVSSGA